MSTDEQRGRVIAELLAAANALALPEPNAVNDGTDCVRLFFKHVRDLRAWADYFGIKTHTMQANEEPTVCLELFEATADGIPIRAVCSSRPVLRLVAS